MLHGLNLNDTKATLQSLITAVNRLEGRLQGSGVPVDVTGVKRVGDPLLRNGWLGVIRDEGPNGEENFEDDDPRYWVERVEGGSDNSSDPQATLDVKSVIDRHDEILSPVDYIVAVNLAECTYTDGGGEVEANEHITPLSSGRLVRVNSVPGAGTFHYFDGALSDDPENTENIGSTNETETANATTVVDADQKIVNDTRIVRMAYNHAGDEKLYAYYRVYTYTAGRLTAISAETRVELDAPEDCP